MSIVLCKDCRFLSYPEGLADAATRMGMLSYIAECHHPSARQTSPVDLVTGITKTSWAGCLSHRLAGYRDTDQNCGPHGRWFEPKEPPEPVGFADDDPSPRTGGAMEKVEDRLDKLEGGA
jgi:hypothetical protein